VLHLSVADGVVVGAFLAALLGLGFSARLRDNSLLQYLAAGRDLSTGAFVATLVSTWYGGILGVGESVQTYGVGAWLLFGVPYYFFALIYALFLAKRVRVAEQISIPERLAARWGPSVGLLTSGLIFLLAVPAAHVLMLGVLVQLITGISRTPAILVGTLVGTLFLYRGGLLADVRASVLAFLMMYVGFAAILIWCVVHYSPTYQWAHLDRKLKDWTGGQGWLNVAGYFILGAWTLVDPGFHQRVASAATPRTGRNGVFICIGFWYLFDMLSMGTALYAIALLKPAPADGMTLYPLLGDQVLPSGLKAVFLCGMLGTIVTAMVGYTLVSGATIGRDIVGRAIPSLSEARVKLMTRVGFVIACMIAICLAVTIDSVVDLWYQWGGAVIGALLLPVLAGYLPRLKLRASPAWVFASMLAAFIISFWWLVHGKRTDNPYLMVNLAGQQFALGTLIPGLLISALILAAGEVASKRIAKT